LEEGGRMLETTRKAGLLTSFSTELMGMALCLEGCERRVETCTAHTEWDPQSFQVQYSNP
jgi:hypothetical protein